MIEGVIWALVAGVMLGLYALPEKYVQDYKYENTWGLFFLIALVILPLMSAVLLVDNIGWIVSSIDNKILISMALLSMVWGVGVQLWSKAINYIGVSLGFSIFIGSVIIVGSLLPFLYDGLPVESALFYIIIGLLIILIGVFCKGFAGILRERKFEQDNVTFESEKSSKMIKGIAIAFFGGIMATGFSLANTMGIGQISELSLEAGNPEWSSAVVVMIIIYLCGAIYVIPYFTYQLFKNNSFHNFYTPKLLSNLGFITVMGVFNFAASVIFAYAAYNLGEAGNSVGYAIYNTSSVVFAVVGGLLAKEWAGAPQKSMYLLHTALGCMVIGVLLIAYSNS